MPTFHDFHDGDEGRPPGSEFGVNVVDWNPLGVCNLRCRHCYGPSKKLKPLPFPDLMQIADLLAQIGTKVIVLTGGEPLIVPRIDDLLAHIAQHGIQIGLSTNTTHFRRHQKAIEEHVSSLNIPIDGSTREIHAMSRCDERSYDTFFDILDHYLDHPTRKPKLLRIGTVYSKANKDDFLRLGERLEKYESIIATWKIYELINHELQQSLRSPILHDGGFDEMIQILVNSSSLSKKIMSASAASRDKAYFMLNPTGQVVIPTELNGIRYERPIGHFLTDSVTDIIAKWKAAVSFECYHGNHGHYQKLDVAV